MARLKVDPELRRQLDAARDDADLVQAVLALRPPSAARAAPSPEETEATVARLLERVRRETGLDGATSTCSGTSAPSSSPARPASCGR